MSTRRTVTVDVGRFAIEYVGAPATVPADMPLGPCGPFFVSSQSCPRVQPISMLVVLPLATGEPVYRRFGGVPVDVGGPSGTLF